MANYPPNVAGVASISSGTGVIVNNADPENPIVGITSPVAAANGGTGLTTSGTDSTKFLRSNGSGGWTLATPAVTAGVSAVTASSPLASSGGATPNITLDSAVPANKGGTGLTTAGNDNTKFLQSDGAGGWQLGTPVGGGGTVTSITAGNGLSGGTITTSGTLSVSFLGADATGGSNDPGGESLFLGGAGDGSGIGGGSTVRGGDGGATSATGGVATLQGGDGGGANGSGGGAFVRGGQKQGSGTDGAVYVGDAFTSSLTLGTESKPMYLYGLISAPYAISNDGGSPQTLSNVTPGTTDVVNVPTTPIKVVEVSGASSPLTLDSTTPIANGTVSGQVFYLFNSLGSGGTFKIPNSSNVIAEYSGGTLDFAPGTVAQFMWIGGFNKWLQIGKALTITM